MKILYILRNAEGGIRTHVETLMMGALARGHEVLLVTDLSQADAGFQKTLQENPELQKHIVSIKMRSAPGPWDLITLWLLAAGLREASFDVVHGHGAKGGLFARLCRVFRILPRSTRVIYTPHGGSLHAMHGLFLNQIYRWIERWLARSTDLVLFESVYTLEQFKNRVGTKSVALRLNRNGINNLEANLKPWPQNLGVKTSSDDRDGLPLRIGAYGLLRTIKGFDTLIEAAHLVRQRGVDLTVDISGEGSERTKLLELIDRLQLNDVVKIQGETANALEDMKKRDIVIQPSLFESFGLVALEAQALGRAVIASHVGGLVDVVLDRETGLLVPPSRPDLLADAIVWMLKNPDQTLLLRTRATHRARTEFSAATMIDGALAAYETTRG